MSFKLNEQAEVRAYDAAAAIKARFDLQVDEVPAKIAVIFTSELEQFVEFKHASEVHLPLSELPGFEALVKMGRVKGHQRSLFQANIGGQEIWGLAGRIHLNEDPTNPGPVNAMVRLQYDMLIHLGVKLIIATSVVGSCTSVLRCGQVAVINQLLCSPSQVFTGCAGEFPMSNDAFDPALMAMALDVGHPFEAVPATHFFWHGPHVESPLQKRLLASWGAHVVGMSAQDAADAARRHLGVRALLLGLVSNGDEHDENTVEDAMTYFGSRWAHYVKDVITMAPNTLGWEESGPQL